jgi:hypothetical protein
MDNEDDMFKHLYHPDFKLFLNFTTTKTNNSKATKTNDSQISMG